MGDGTKKRGTAVDWRCHLRSRAGRCRAHFISRRKTDKLGGAAVGTAEFWLVLGLACFVLSRFLFLFCVCGASATAAFIFTEQSQYRRFLGFEGVAMVLLWVMCIPAVHIPEFH